MRGQLKSGPIIILIIIVMVTVFFACEPKQYEVYDDVITETLEITYQNGDIDTVDVERNPMCPYTLIEGDLKARKRPIQENTYAYGTYLIKCGVRDFKIIDK